MLNEFKNSLGSPQKVTCDIPKRPGSSTPRYGTNEGNCPRRDPCRVRPKSPEVETNIGQVREKLPGLRPHGGVLASRNSRGGGRGPQLRRALKTRRAGEAGTKARAAGPHVHGTSATGKPGRPGTRGGCRVGWGSWAAPRLEDTS